MNSVPDILRHTPLPVWIALGAIVSIGARQLRSQRIAAGRVWGVPLLVAIVSLGSAVRAFAGAGELLTGACWAIGAVLGFLSNRSLDLPRRVSANADGSFTVGGSVAPLLLFLGVFVVRYVVNVALAIAPALARDPAAAAGAAIAYGLTAGLLAARSRKIWSSRRERDHLVAA